jgi:pyruvate dehydrogenase E1 component
MGEAGEASNETHSLKKLDVEALKAFRDRFAIPIDDKDLAKVPYYRPDETARRCATCASSAEELGGPLPCGAAAQAAARARPRRLQRPDQGQRRARDLHHHGLRAHARRWPRTRPSASASCPSCPTRRAPSAWRACSASSASTPPGPALHAPRLRPDHVLQGGHQGPDPRGGHQRGRRHLRLARRGDVLQHQRLPDGAFYIFYSMFGFQRIGDLAWAAGDSQARGFLIGGTPGARR